MEPFGIIGSDADIYIYMPIEQNRSIVEQVLPLGAGKDMKMALGRTTAVYSGVFFNQTGSEVRVCARGKYPYGMTDSFFKKKNGWNPKKQKTDINFMNRLILMFQFLLRLLHVLVWVPKTEKVWKNFYCV